MKVTVHSSTGLLGTMGRNSLGNQCTCLAVGTTAAVVVVEVVVPVGTLAVGPLGCLLMLL